MKKKLPPIALALVLALSLVPTAFAAQPTEVAGLSVDGAFIISNVVSTSAEPAAGWQDDIDFDAEPFYGAELLWDGIKTYYCESAPVTLTLAENAQTCQSMFWWWGIGAAEVDDNLTNRAWEEDLTEGYSAEDLLLYGNLIMNTDGIYLFIAVNDGTPFAFYVVVGDGGAEPETKTALPTASRVYINGAEYDFEAYNIDGNNYFKLRDLASALNNTQKQFEVGYDSDTKSISLVSGEPYTSVGGEMSKGDGTAKTATPTESTVYLDGAALDLTAYLINDNNFIKLRDLMQALDVFVGYDELTKGITLDPGQSYDAG